MSALEELQSVVCLIERRLLQLEVKQEEQSTPAPSRQNSSLTLDGSKAGREAIIGLYMEAMNAARLDIKVMGKRASRT